MAVLKHILKYSIDSTKIFSRLHHKPWAIFLDSGKPHGEYGRFDIVVADPFITICTSSSTKGLHTEIRQNGVLSLSDDDPFAILDRLLVPYQLAKNDASFNTICSALPFMGGAVGYFGYDLMRHDAKLPAITEQNNALPQMMVGIYDWAIIVDHREKTACLISYGFEKSTQDNWAVLCALLDAPATLSSNDFKLTTAISSNMNFDSYAKAYNQIKFYITQGDCYQVNLAQRFSAKATGDSWAAYKKLREISPAPFMAYMNFGNFQILSGSPERFLQVTGQHVETRPIKGTRPRSNNKKRDHDYAVELQASTKDRAENLMIVDLLRNDISKNCEIGSVKAKPLFQLQSFANVHHLVSFITGTLRVGKTAIDLLRDCFPGGSITGAPKLRAMQVIEELEPHSRGVYCGAIGYIGFDGNMDTSIAIRTAVFKQDNGNEGEVSFYAGGGIVADSMLDKEYAETLDKASSMVKTMQYFNDLD